MKAARSPAPCARFLNKTIDSLQNATVPSLDPAGKARLKEIDRRRSPAHHEVSENVLDATNAYELVLTMNPNRRSPPSASPPHALPPKRKAAKLADSPCKPHLHRRHDLISTTPAFANKSGAPTHPRHPRPPRQSAR